jgi:hypothetical protein
MNGRIILPIVGNTHFIKNKNDDVQTSDARMELEELTSDPVYNVYRIKHDSLERDDTFTMVSVDSNAEDNEPCSRNWWQRNISELDELKEDVCPQEETTPAIPQHTEKEGKIEIFSWNARSVASRDKLEFLEDNTCNILCIQESWLGKTSTFTAENTENSSISTKVVRFDRDDEGQKRGGGTLTILSEGFITRQARLSQDYGILKVVINGCRLWILNVYLSKGTRTQVQEMFMSIERLLSVEDLNHLIIVGDFNINLKKQSDQLNTLKTLAKQLGLIVIEPNKATRNDTTLDFAIASKALKVEAVVVDTNLSDHNAVKFSITPPRFGKPKNLRILNRKIAADATMEAISEAKDAKGFLQRIHDFRKQNKDKTYKVLNKRQVERKLFLSVAQEKEVETKIILDKYWKELIEGNEKLRYSMRSKEAFQFLKRVYKYNQFEPRDGSIVNKVIVNGNIVAEEDEVNRLIMDNLKNIQMNAKFPTYAEPFPFPKLDELTIEEMETILKRMYPGKAIATDFVTDDIFDKGIRDKVTQIFKDLWSGLNIREYHFKSRLVPLNKKHPDLPKPDQIRPIVVSSPLVKLLESRLGPKLREYGKDRLHRSQTGFVDEMDIYVNMWRALKRIEEVRTSRKYTYCLFLDFSSAYNTVPHHLLFQRLEGILTAEEINLIKAIYSRTTISLGKEKFRPNIGVAQGSVISPMLFNIYAESLLKELENNGWKVEDLLGFADDHLIICLTKGSLRDAIRIVKRWCEDANIKLNPDKSGILEIPPKGAKHTMEVGRRFEDIPIVSEYKYLGLILDNNLDGNKHLEKLFGWKDQSGKKHQGKIQFIKYNLSPLIRNISLDYRINLWQILIRPLFLPLAMLSNYLCESAKVLMERKLKKSIKWFLGLTSKTPDDVVFTLVKVNFKEWARVEGERARLKWEARISYEDVSSLPEYKVTCGVKWMPREVAHFINLQNSYCKQCGYIMNARHYQKHGVEVCTVPQLLEELERRIKSEEDRVGKKLLREEVLDISAEYVRSYIEKMGCYISSTHTQDIS